jgi:hypothetical protein
VTSEGLNRVDRWLPPALAAVLTGIILGPALGPGVVLSYDLGWSPDPRWTPFVLGQDTPAPRVVPSDAAGVLLGHLLTGAGAEKTVLFTVLMLAAVGAVALLRWFSPLASAPACCAAVVMTLWNPFVAERLVIGQWTILMGYAVLPWASRAALRLRSGRGTFLACGGCVVVGGLGGANTVLLVVSTMLVVFLYPAPRWRPAALVFLTALGVGAAWWLPALARGTSTGTDGLLAFGATQDGPLGLVGSLLTGGGMWNPASHPAERGNVVLALVALTVVVVCTMALVRTPRTAPLLLAAVLGVVLAVLSGWAPFDPAWSGLAHVPGGGLLRDGQKLVATWMVLIAVGFGLAVDRLGQSRGVVTGVALAFGLIPVLSLPSLAWGVHGRLSSVSVPQDLRLAASVLSRAGKGDLGVLPWRQYRRYEWNDGRVSLSLIPRMVDQRVLYDDSLPLKSGRVNGEDSVSASVTSQIDRGADPLDALANAGVRYVVVERRTGLAEPAVPAGFGTVMLDTPHLLVIERAVAENVHGAGGPRGYAVAGWTISLGTWLFYLATGAWSCRGRRAHFRPKL